MKSFLIFLLFIVSSQFLLAEEFKIHKHEVALETLEKQRVKAQETLDSKVIKSKQVLLEKYYNDLERHFAFQMKTKNLDLANKVNAKKEKIFKMFKQTQEDLKPKVDNTPKVSAKSSKMGFLGSKELSPYSSSYSSDLKPMEVGQLIFKKGGDYIGQETWKTIPDYLKGKKFTFMSHEKDSNNSRAYYKTNKNGYLYFLSTSSRSGLERVGQAYTSGGRGFHVYKYFAYEGDSIHAYCSGSYENILILNN